MHEKKQVVVRRIHVNLPEEVHRRLRVKCALEDVTIQEFVASALARAVVDVSLPRPSAGKKP